MANSVKTNFCITLGKDCFIVNAHERLLIVGESGSGKNRIVSAFVDQRNNLHNAISYSGKPLNRFSDCERASLIGYVPANPCSVFSGLTTTVETELTLSFDFIGKTCNEEAKRKIILDLNLSELLARNPYELSGGEKTRFALALALICRPKLLILDQCFDQLSSDIRETILGVVDQFLSDGGIVVETHTMVPNWHRQTDRYLFLMENSRIFGTLNETRRMVLKNAPHLLDQESWESIYSSKRRQKPLNKNGSRVTFLANQIAFSYEATGFGVGPLSATFKSGDSVAIKGPNGAGKTTLLMTLALLRQPKSGEISITADSTETVTSPRSMKKSHLWAKHVLYSFQEPDDQIYCDSIEKELSETSKQVGFLGQDWIDFVCRSLNLNDLLADSPMSVPRPTRRLITIGSAVSARPTALLLDEPTAWLDRKQKNQLLTLLESYLSNGGICIFISHDDDFINLFANRVICVNEGQIMRDVRI